MNRSFPVVLRVIFAVIAAALVAQFMLYWQAINTFAGTDVNPSFLQTHLAVAPSVTIYVLVAVFAAFLFGLNETCRKRQLENDAFVHPRPRHETVAPTTSTTAL